ncbi:AraC family transcriptional regulator [Mycolicibacterium hodleri]|uniref:AraC family transcriptional regulator n=1 Tax=Mycolicibacterium hodleri TaxID=49897 RepID=A0A502E8R5_9MYCO|nr:AraC family transcriptional regulator [Mycolicibacterium hodleri]TPG32906.1 AraC family transcriptional regulator [Mycolicibacterium hodleri]
MAMGSLIRATNLWGYGDLMQKLGADPEPFLKRFDIPQGIEHQDDAFVSLDAFVRMLEASCAELDCPDFGLRLARWQGLDILGPIAVIARNAQTLFSGLSSIAQYLYVHSPALKLTVAPPTAGCNVEFRYEVTNLAFYPLQGYELSMANAVRMIRLLGGPEARPRAISFMHDQLGSDAAYSDSLGCTVRFGQTWCGFEVPHHLAGRPIDSADPETRRIATKYLEAHYLPSTATLSERVTELARRLLPTGQCSADVISDQLAMHPRTLQRRLATEGVRFQDLIERERRDQAAKYLAEPGLHLSQITGLLGYSEQSALNRSCRRWFGQTPRQYRAGLPVSRLNA